MNLVANKEREHFRVGLRKLAGVFDKVSAILEVNGIKHNAYREEFYICVDTRKTTAGKVKMLLDNALSEEYGELSHKKYKMCVSNSGKKVTILFKK